MMDKILVTDIQRFSFHDGPGIRTTVFLKGCSIRCPWCSNPENLEPAIQRYIKDGNEGLYGRWYSSAELYQEVIRDKEFYIGDITEYKITDPMMLDKLPGGVTFSGGECLLQMSELEDVLRRLHSEKIHITIETSLFSNIEQLEIALKYVDLFYVDIKILDKMRYRNVLKGNLDSYYNNLSVLMKRGALTVARIPVIAGFTDDIENRERVAELLGSFQGNLLKVEIIKEHNLGISKYQSLRKAGTSIKVPDYKGVEDNMLIDYRARLKKYVNVPVEVCKI